MLVTIDEYAGFCPGVIRAVRNAEKILDEKAELFCLGDLVHNDEEIKRLEKKGLKTIYSLEGLKDKDVMFRAHGEPPESYILADKNNLILSDNTCSIVKKLQQNIKEEFEKPTIKNIVIFGKKSHPEVIGLDGQTSNTAIIVEEENDITQIDFSKDVVLFSQTTMNAEKYNAIIAMIEEKARKVQVNFKPYYSICKQVSRRVEKIKGFSRQFDLVLFVSGKKSSNGKYLFSIMKDENKNSYWISGHEDINSSWFKGVSSVGISGATSTPPWLLEKVADFVKHM